MKILLTNDDGVNAPGIESIKEELVKLGDVTVVAPERQRSAMSHSITLYEPLIIKRIDDRKNGVARYAINGTPVDSVKLAIRELLPEPPDLVVSGINQGLNTGSNVFYSGTVAAAMEGSLFGITSIALSVENKPEVDFRRTARMARKIVEYIVKKHLKTSRSEGGSAVTFNVNIPAVKPEKIRGIKVTYQELTPFEDVYDRRRDLIGRTYFWIKGNAERTYQSPSNGAGELYSDARAVSEGYISITPLKRELTDHATLSSIRIPAKIKL